MINLFTLIFIIFPILNLISIVVLLKLGLKPPFITLLIFLTYTVLTYTIFNDTFFIWVIIYTVASMIFAMVLKNFIHKKKKN